jgi:two-component system, chemotaxis family, chemotaxis protein CheY
MSCDRKIPDDRLASTKVLVVNDDHGANRFIRNLLAAMGFRNIYHAANGATGLDLVRAKAPDIIVLDWDMGLDGQRFMQTVRTPGKCPKPDVSIIMLIGLASRGRVANVAQFSKTKFLMKPLSSRTMEECLAAVIEVANEPWRAVLSG